MTEPWLYVLLFDWTVKSTREVGFEAPGLSCRDQQGRIQIDPDVDGGSKDVNCRIC